MQAVCQIDMPEACTLVCRTPFLLISSLGMGPKNLDGDCYARCMHLVLRKSTGPQLTTHGRKHVLEMFGETPDFLAEHDEQQQHHRKIDKPQHIRSLAQHLRPPV